MKVIRDLEARCDSKRAGLLACGFSDSPFLPLGVRCASERVLGAVPEGFFWECRARRRYRLQGVRAGHGCLSDCKFISDGAAAPAMPAKAKGAQEPRVVECGWVKISRRARRQGEGGPTPSDSPYRRRELSIAAVRYGTVRYFVALSTALRRSKNVRKIPPSPLPMVCVPKFWWISMHGSSRTSSIHDRRLCHMGGRAVQRRCVPGVAIADPTSSAAWGNPSDSDTVQY
jgi:hypothetical protein